jgi:Asp/Glu/hydantoin racemase
MNTPVSFLHTSPAAIPPIMQFYGQAAPDLEITNQLDDGLLRMFSAEQYDASLTRLRNMLDVAIGTYSARLVMITCSSVPGFVLDELRKSAHIPVIKIDDPMAAAAVQAGRRIGIAITFAPTTQPTQRLLEAAAKAAGKQIELVPLVVPGAYDALLSGNVERHDELLIGGVDQLEAQKVDAIVLAQVSMARVHSKLEGRIKVPVFSSLRSSLGRIRELLILD